MTSHLVAGVSTFCLLVATTAGFAQQATRADTSRYVVVNHGRPAGTLVVARRGDSAVARYQFVDRDEATRVETRYVLANSGAVASAEVRTLAPDGAPTDPTARFQFVNDSVRWAVRAGARGRGAMMLENAAPARPRAVFRLNTVTPFDDALLARFLLRQPERSAPLFPSGTARVEIVAQTRVRTATGQTTVRLAMISGLGQAATPFGVWLDERDELFASDVAWFTTVRAGAEAALPALRALEIPYRNAQAEALARRVAPAASGSVVIRNGDVFDSESATIRPRTTVVVRGDRIVAVGPADSIAPPVGATVIDATGKTVIPGLWDMHVHTSLRAQGSASVRQLAAGITTVRDLAADLDVAVSLRDRAAAGLVAAPRMLLAGFIEGPGEWAGPSEAIVSTGSQARAWIARYDSLGYRQIKIYNLVHPNLIPTIVDEATTRGMRVGGHIPRGLSVAAAVHLGFQEVNHSAFLLATFFPDSMWIPRLRGPWPVAASVAPRFDVEAPEVRALIELLRQRGTVIDGTFWMCRSLAPPGTWPACQRLLKRLFDAGVPLVIGTDGGPGELLFELGAYENAGIPAARALQIATLGAARVMGDDKEYGSISVGKIADIVVVDGQPAERVNDLANVEIVLRAGRVYERAKLLAALANHAQ